MPLNQRLTAAGHWLFRWRSFLPILLVIAAVVAMYPFPLPHHDTRLAVTVEFSCIMISVGGMVLRAVTIGHTPAGTSGRNTEKQIASTLNTTGVYSIVRHPLYLANFLIGLGLAGFTLNGWFAIIYVLTFWLYYERIMLAEESFLRTSFGEQFETWAQRTPPFIPSFRGYVAPELPFSFRNVLKREYNTILQIVVVCFLLEFFGDWYDTRVPGTSLPWVMFLTLGTLVWISLRTLRRNSRMLDVEGR